MFDDNDEEDDDNGDKNHGDNDDEDKIRYLKCIMVFNVQQTINEYHSIVRILSPTGKYQ